MHPKAEGSQLNLPSETKKDKKANEEN